MTTYDQRDEIIATEINHAALKFLHVLRNPFRDDISVETHLRLEPNPVRDAI
jgi:hypothetical protein